MPITINGDGTVTGISAGGLPDNIVDGGNIALGSDATGDIMYYNGTDYIRLGKPGSDMYLKNTSGGTVSWAAVASPTRSISADTGWVEMVGSSGSASQITLTGIAAGAMKLTLLLSGIKWSSSEELLIELGDSGGIETSGYVGMSQYWGSSGGQVGGTTDGWMSYGIDPGSIISGSRIDMWRADSTTHKWQMWGDIGYETGSLQFTGMMQGFKTLSAELTQIRVGSDGSSTIDTGSEYRLITWT